MDDKDQIAQDMLDAIEQDETSRKAFLEAMRTNMPALPIRQPAEAKATPTIAEQACLDVLRGHELRTRAHDFGVPPLYPENPTNKHLVQNALQSGDYGQLARGFTKMVQDAVTTVFTPSDTKPIAGPDDASPTHRAPQSKAFRLAQHGAKVGFYVP